MKFIFQFIKLRCLYNFFLFLALLNIFFSTENINAKTFLINDIEISTPFKINFDKNEIIEKGFVKAYNQLISSLVQSKDQMKLKNTSLSQIKGMVNTFSIKEEKFINEKYHLTLSVSFNKKNIFNLLEKKNIFPSIPTKKKVIFIPIIVDLNKNEIKMYSENEIFNLWNSNKKRYELLNYILPSEDLEDFNLIKNNINKLENFDFYKIVNKYNLKDYIVAILFKNDEDIKLLNKINFNEKKTLKNLKINKLDFKKQKDVNDFNKKLKTIYEDYWKSQNQINTSVKLGLFVSMDNSNNIKISQFEQKLSNVDLIYNYYIYKFNNKNNIYRITFNGTPDKFLETMKLINYEFEIKNKVWVLK